MTIATQRHSKKLTRKDFNSVKVERSEYDLPPGTHEEMHFGKLTLYRHFYDGLMVIAVDFGGLKKDGGFPGRAVHAREVDKALRKLFKLPRRGR